MSDTTIRFAENKDIPKIMEFIDTYWKKGHILSRDRKLFEWQYINYGHVCFVLGIDKSETIQGILGYVPYDNSEEKDIALALWKANKSADFLGVKLLIYLIKAETHRNIFCPGINMKTTAKIYEKIGLKVGKMNLWFRLNCLDEYKIAKVVDKYIPDYRKKENQSDFIKINDINDLTRIFDFSRLNKNQVPYKSESYICKRYFNHPTYNYLVYALLDENRQSDCLLVFRLQKQNNSCALRLVDCIGNSNELIFATRGIDELLNKYSAEYVDFYEAGIDNRILENAGWRLVDCSQNIIPNYFSPFEQKVVDIYYCSSNSNAVLCKGDGDQDRPN